MIQMKRGGEECDAAELSDPPGNGRSFHVSDLHDDWQHERPAPERLRKNRRSSTRSFS